MMNQSMIERLRFLSPEDRPALLQETYDRNMAFFRQHQPALLKLVKKQKCPYQLNITPEFLAITHEATGELAHPQAGLDTFASMMGDWVHDAWIDLCNFKVPAMDLYPLHGGPLRKIYQQLLTEFPESLIRFSLKQVNLKELPDGRRFSPPVIFLGIFHGLHIDYYLSRTEVSHILLVEPDPRRFEVSCYFLDYRQISEESEVVFSIGPDPQSEAIKYYFSNYSVSRQLWTRVLPAYEDPQNPHLLESFRMHQATMSNVVFPLDYDYAALRNIAANIERRLPLLTTRPRLSGSSRIAVVASGPSLDRDIEWLRDNQDNLLIFAVVSAVKPLLENGIKPDFQMTMETMIRTKGLRHLLKLDPEIPAVVSANVPESVVDYFDQLFVCGVGDKVAPIQFTLPLHRVLPSTTNMAFSFACLCNPQEIFLFGCDFGYFSADKNHASGTMYDQLAQLSEKHKKNYLISMQQLVSEANFPDEKSSMITTTPFLTHARIVMEQTIDTVAKNIKIYNCSDGARIKGARRRQSSNINIRSYAGKKDDIQKIKNAFVPAQKNINWRPYKISAEKVVGELKKEVVSRLDFKPFTWKECNKTIDTAVLNAVLTSRENDRDRRPEVYVYFLLHLLTALYKVLLFADRQDTAEEIYRSGLAKIREVVEKLEWPVKEFD
ncbi:motility associated factor glycosyltransferase family protein [Desulfolithobacter sp.]